MTLGSWIKRLGHQEDNYGGIDRKEIERLVANAGRVPRSVSSSSVKQPSTVKRSRTVSGSAASSYQRRRPAPRHIVVNKRPVVVSHKDTQDLPEPKLIEIPHAPKSVFESGIDFSTETERKSSTENRYVPYRATLGRGASVIPPEELGEVEPSDDDSSSIEQGVLPYPEEGSDSESEVDKSEAAEGKPTAAETVKADALLDQEKTDASDAKRNNKLGNIKRSHTTGGSSRRVSTQSSRMNEYDAIPTTSAFGTKLDTQHNRESNLAVRKQEKTPTPSKPAGVADVFSSKTSDAKTKKTEPRSKAETKFTEAITPVSSKKSTTNESSKASESAKTISSMKAVESQTAKSEKVKPVTNAAAAAEKAPPVPPKDEKKPSTQYVPSYLSGGPATYKSDLPAYLRTGKASDKAHLKEAVQTTEPKADTSKGKSKDETSNVANDESSKQAEQKAAEQRAAQEKAKQAERDLADKQAKEKAAKQKDAEEKAQKEAEDKLKRENAEKQAKEKAAKEKAEQEAARANAQQKAEKEASSKQANEKASTVSTPSLTSSKSFMIASSNGDKPAPRIVGLDDLYNGTTVNSTKSEARDTERKPSSSAGAAPAWSSASLYDTDKKNQPSSTAEPVSKASSSDVKSQSSGAAPALSQASIYSSSRSSAAEKDSKNTEDSKKIKSVLPEFMRQNSFDTAVSTRAIPPHSRRNSEEITANASQSEVSKSSGLAPPIRDASVLGLSKSSEQPQSARSVSSELKDKSSSLSRDSTKPVSQSKDADSSASKDENAAQSKSDYPKASVTHSIMSKAPLSQPKPVEMASENPTLKPESKDVSDKAQSSQTTQPKTQALATETGKPARPATRVLESKKDVKTESGAASAPKPVGDADAVTKSEPVKSETSKATSIDQSKLAPTVPETSALPSATTNAKQEEVKPSNATEKSISTDSTPKPPVEASKARTVSSGSAAVPKITEPTTTNAETGVSAAKPSTETSAEKVADKASAPATSQSTAAKVETKTQDKVESKNSSSILAAFRKKDKKKNKATKK